jgi:hypothetical protein
MRIFISFLLAVLMSASAVAQTQKTRSGLTTEINTNFADNAAGAITPAIARTTYLDMLASWQMVAATSLDNADVVMTAADRYVYTTTTTLTDDRTVTLPAANALQAGEMVAIADAGGAIGLSSYTISIARAGSDTINNSAASLVIRVSGGSYALMTDGVSNWGVVSIYEDRSGQIFNVRDYGADPTGAVSSDTAFANAISAASSAGGGVVYVPSTNGVANCYTLTEKITLPGRVDLIGASSTNTCISSEVTDDDLILVSGTSRVENITILQVGAQADDYAAIHLTGSGGIIAHVVMFADCASNSFGNHIKVDTNASGVTAFSNKISNVQLTCAAGAGILVGTGDDVLDLEAKDYVVDLYIRDSIIDKANNGIVLLNGDGFYFDNIDILNSTLAAFVTYPGSGQSVGDLFSKALLADTSGYDGFQVNENGGSVGNLNFDNCWASGSAANAGIDILGAANGVTFNSCQVLANYTQGIQINAGSNISVLNSQIYHNSISANDTYDGIAVSADVTGGIMIMGNTIGQGGKLAALGGTNQQRYGIGLVGNESSNTIDNYMITNNRCPGNVTGGFRDAHPGSNAVVTNACVEW